MHKKVERMTSNEQFKKTFGGQSMNNGKSFFARKWKRYTIYGLIGFAVWHYVYYTIEFNEKVKKPEERRDMAYIHWLKKHFPFLRQYGIPYREDSANNK